MAGTYEVKLTVTDSFGETSTATFTLTVKERTAVGTVKVKVVDEKGKIIPQAPVYYNLGEENQKVIYTDSNGYSSYNLAGGETLVGCYKSGYLPVRKQVTVLTNATRKITLTMIKEELVTGTFEVTRMTFNEIVDAGIDVYDPANQNVYSVEVTVTYGEQKVPIKYIRNDKKIIKYTINNSGGTSENNNSNNSKYNNSTIGGVSFIPNTENKEFIAILQFDATAKSLKEFFDVKLHIVNNATKDIVLTNNEVKLNIPDGLHLMNNVSGDWCKTENVKFDKLVGQETKTLSWILRGDKIGSYELSADYQGVLSQFNETVKTSFKTDTNIDVYGMSNIMFDIEVCSEIHYNAFYFNIGIKNNGDIDTICPSLDFDNIVKNITSTALQIDPSDENYSPDFKVSATLMNVRAVTADNQSRYINYNFTSNGEVTTDVNTLAPNEAIYFDYVAYNAINYDGIAEFKSAICKVLDGIGGGVNIRAIDMNYYSFANPTEKVDDLTSSVDNNRKSSADYLLDGNNFVYVKNSDMANSLGEGVYNSLKLALTLDFETLTDNEKKKLIDEIIVKMITDDNSEQNIDGLVNDQYVSAVKNVLSVMEDSCDSFDFGDNTTKEKVTTIISNALNNTNTINELAGNLENADDEDSIINSFYVKLGLSAVGGVSVTTFKKLVGDNLGYSENSALFKGITGASKYGGMALEFLVENPINAYNEALTSRYLYTQLKAQASIEQATLLLNTLISYYTDEDRFKDFMKETLLSSTMYKAANTNYKKLICEEAKKLKDQLLNDSYNFRLELAKNFTAATANSVANIALEEAISKSLGKLAIWYEVLSVAFQTADSAFGIGDMYSAADSFAIATYISMAVETGYKTISAGYNNTTDLISSGLFKDIVSDKTSFTKETLAEYTLYEMKSLCQIRLLGEQLFYKYINSDNSNILHSDKDFDKKIVKEINSFFGINAKDTEEVFDYIYEKILSSRDAIFDIERKENITQPLAPTVNIDYTNLRTVEKFDEKYEYCREDGIWYTCDGYINVYPKSVRTILRVRLKSSDNNMSGKITTVNVYAKKSVSKNVSVRYSDGIYYLSNLNENYSYQVSPVSSLSEKVNWSNAVTIYNMVEATVDSLNASDYLAIRILENKELEITTSEPTVLKVDKKLPLNIIVEGDGNVTQTNKDGYYFIGDDVTVTAEKSTESTFAGWYINGKKVSQDPTYILEMTEYAEIVAKFISKSDVKATSINLTLPYSENKDIFYVGEVEKLVADFTPSNTSDKSVKWTSSNTSVATVNATGTVSFLKEGSVTITATSINGISSEYNFNVKENKVEKLVIASDFFVRQYIEGETFCDDGLKLIAVYTDGSSSYIDDYTVTGFDNSKAGKQTLTIKSNGKTVSTSVTVLHNGNWKVVKDTTCKTQGKMEYVCSSCGEVISHKDIDKLSHTEVTDAEIKPTCEKEGLTEGSHCSVCGEIIVPQNTIEKLSHKAVIDKEVKPTYTNTGLTEGSHCSVCGKVLVPQKTLPKLKKTVINVKSNKISIYVKDKSTVKATVINGKGVTTYRSSNTKIAKVNSKGVITTYKTGTVKITITNNNVSKSVIVTVKKPKLNKSSITLKKNKTFTLKVIGKAGNTKFSTSNKKVVVVNSNGKIIAKKKGMAIVFVKTSGVTLKCKVKVK